MKLLLLGATGLIGSHLAARLRLAGFEVVGVGRRRPVAPSQPWIQLDLREATSPSAWIPHLQGVDAVVNCAGVLQDGPGDNTRAVHADAPIALYQACRTVGVRRVIHFSAVGVDRGQVSPFSATKALGEASLMASDLDWVILRPSVVLGDAAYGGSALFRGLAALPVAFKFPDTGPLHPAQ